MEVAPSKDEDSVIKPEYVVSDHKRVLSLHCVSEDSKRKLIDNDDDVENWKKVFIKEDKNLKGQNKSRKKFIIKADNKLTLCNYSAKSTPCPLNNCKFLHDKQLFLKSKPDDIDENCYVFNLRGYCPHGIVCRFGKKHLTEDGENVTNKELYSKFESDESWKSINMLSKDLRKSLWKNKFDFSKTNTIISEVNKVLKKDEEDTNKVRHYIGPVDDTDLIKLRPEEKKKINWSDKLYLSPLTTVGNLPFRRICKEYGADITCGEMALASSLLQGQAQEWALVRRHPCEDLFGVQIAGNKMPILTRCAQLLNENITVDFVDINMGCPIDLVYSQGSGSALLKKKSAVRAIVHAVNRVLDCPLTVKVRTGVSSKLPIAHKLMPLFNIAGVSLVTVHGRSREQRFIRSADWEYIEKCAEAAKPMAVFGNGDILSYRDYRVARETCPSVSGAMIGRGALMKPWIFTEIKEKRDMDPSSSERLEMLKKYVNYGLEHWGSDTRGIETTRRFLLEWLSFLYRYTPNGLLVNPPQVMNQRPPYYKGRDDLETLMASPNCADWIKISEMLLNKVPEGFTFLPKHKANAWT